MSDRIGQLRVIWGALVGGVLLYTALIYGMMASGVIEMGVLDASIMNPVGAAVMVYMAGGILVRRRLLEGIQGGASDGERMAAYFRATVLSLGLTESGGLLVITAGLLADSPTWVLAGGGTAAALMFLAIPSADDIA